MFVRLVRPQCRGDCRVHRAALVVLSCALRVSSVLAGGRLPCDGGDACDSNQTYFTLLQTTFDLEQPASQEVPLSYVETLVVDPAARQSLIAEAAARLRAAKAAARARVSAENLASIIADVPAETLVESPELLRPFRSDAQTASIVPAPPLELSHVGEASALVVEEGAQGTSTTGMLFIPGSICFCCLCFCFCAIFYGDLENSGKADRKPHSHATRSPQMSEPFLGKVQAAPSPPASMFALQKPLGSMPLPPPSSPPASSALVPGRPAAASRPNTNTSVSKAPPLGSFMRLHKGTAHFSIATSELVELSAGRGGAEIASAHLAGFPLMHLNISRQPGRRILEIAGSPGAEPEVSIDPVLDPWVEKHSQLLVKGKPFGTFARFNYQDFIVHRVIHEATCVLEIRRPNATVAQRAGGPVILQAYHGEGSDVLAATVGLGVNPKGPPSLMIDVESETDVMLAMGCTIAVIIATPELICEVERWRGSIGGGVP